MKRKKILLSQIAERNNLSIALHKAARAKKHRPEVASYLQNAAENLGVLAKDIINEKLPYGRYRQFTIHDPKKRIIHAACFEDRIFHHALMNIAGGLLERAMSSTSFACRPNMGVHHAIIKVQKYTRCFPWYCQVDISGYFAAIDHDILQKVLLTRYKGREMERQIKRILNSYNLEGVDKEIRHGLPIGALTSQYFANYYLDGLDRLLEMLPQVRAHIRYMDDIVWWCENKGASKSVLLIVKTYLLEKRKLQIKPTWRMQRSQQGLLFCGFRVLPGIVRLSRRRKRRYQQRRLYWESCYRKGFVTDIQLQQAYASVYAITIGTDSLQWRKQNLLKFPAMTV